MKQIFIVGFGMCAISLASCSGLLAETTSVEEYSVAHGNDVNLQEKYFGEAYKRDESKKDASYKVADNWSIIPNEEGINEKVVLLTIDDAPDKYSLEMAKTLKKLNVSGIFFVNGDFLDTPEKAETLKEIYDMGFVIGNHTYSHPLLSELTEEEQREEIVRLSDRVEEIIGERPKFFRAPNGVNTDFSKNVVEEEGMVLMNWSFGYDWEAEYQTKNAITDIMLNTNLLRNGSNLLMHDRKWTAEALADIVRGLKEKGYEVVDPKLIQTK